MRPRKTPQLAAGFPNAPPESYVSEEGWLIVGDEAWTSEEWRLRPSERPKTVRALSAYADVDERLERRRASSREHMRRKRAAARAAQEGAA